MSRWRKNYQLCAAKQEQDLFLSFLIKKALHSLEKVAIVPISDVSNDKLMLFLSLSMRI